VELKLISEKTGLPGDELIRSSKLTAKIDNTAIQDGYQLYLHSFIVTRDKEWAVIQQGMHAQNGLARRYHWLSSGLDSYLDNPHTSICGRPAGQIINLADVNAAGARQSILDIGENKPDLFLKDIQYLSMPSHHDVSSKDINFKRLGAMLYVIHEANPNDFETLLLLKGLGPRTLQSLALVSEVIFGTPARFQDPARFSFAHGGKDGHPFPVPLKVYNETIDFMDAVVRESKIDHSEKKISLEKLHLLAKSMEPNFIPDPSRYAAAVDREHRWSKKYGGRTVFDDKSKKTSRKNKLSGDERQLHLF
jgi:hypothetical protein